MRGLRLHGDSSIPNEFFFRQMLANQHFNIGVPRNDALRPLVLWDNIDRDLGK